MREEIDTGHWRLEARPKACRAEGSDPRSGWRGLRTDARPKHSIRWFKIHLLTLCFILASLGASAESPCNPESITAAQQSYDLGVAILVLEACELEAPVRTGEAHRELVARAALLVAELHRIDFEAAPKSKRPERRALGLLIDEAADTGLKSLKDLPETSERLRLEADLLATKIRSDYRGKKYSKKMKAAAARALELDPSNARAIVSQAKPFLFAETRHGGDLEEAVRRLGEALIVEPTLESALLLRALAYERQGETEASRIDLKAALAANPQCRPAHDRLKDR